MDLAFCKATRLSNLLIDKEVYYLMTSKKAMGVGEISKFLYGVVDEKTGDMQFVKFFFPGFFFIFAFFISVLKIIL